MTRTRTQRVRLAGAPVIAAIPDQPGRRPTIVFSHGFGGDESNFAEITQTWAERGWVVLQPRHSDALVGVDAVERRRRLRRLRDELERVDLWRERLRTIMSLVEPIGPFAKAHPEVSRRIDYDCVAVAGHSLGALAASFAVGLSSTKWPDLNLAQPPWRAALLVSPQGTGQQGLTDTSWDHITCPLLTITGTHDGSLMGHDASWRETPFRLAASPRKLHAFFEGAGHHSFGGFDATRPKVTGALGECGFTGAMQQLTSAFWSEVLEGVPFGGCQIPAFVRLKSVGTPANG